MEWEQVLDEISEEISEYIRWNGVITGLDYEIISRYVEAAEHILGKEYSSFTAKEWEGFKYGLLVANEKVNQDSQNLF